MLLRFLTLLLALIAGGCRWPPRPRSRSRSACPCPSRARPRSSASPRSKGAQMYVEELNAKGGVLGRKIELIVARLQGGRQRGGARRRAS